MLNKWNFQHTSKSTNFSYPQKAYGNESTSSNTLLSPSYSTHPCPVPTSLLIAGEKNIGLYFQIHPVASILVSYALYTFRLFLTKCLMVLTIRRKVEGTGWEGYKSFAQELELESCEASVPKWSLPSTSSIKYIFTEFFFRENKEAGGKGVYKI